MKRYRYTVTAAVLCTALLGAAAPALAAPPTIERVPIDEAFVDTENCDFAFDVTIVGTRINRTFDRPGRGVQFVSTVNATATLSANGNTVRLKDVGADVVTQRPDGTLVLSIAGQVPFGFKGVLKLNETTGEVLLEPRRQVDADAICAALEA